jgi:acetolactate synthase-1/2/3 large subunit
VKIRVADYIASFLEVNGVRRVYEVSGGMITFLLDALTRTDIEVVSMHHEQSAAFAVDAEGRMNNRPAVAMATSGPGALNLLTGLGSCYFDSSPAMFITGQVNRNEQKGTLRVRQLGFQETDIVSIAAPIAKAAIKVDEPSQVPLILRDAFRIATAGRPGPVLLDIPMDVQRCVIEVESPTQIDTGQRGNVDTGPFLTALFQSLRESKRPLILAGGGVRSAVGATKLLRSLVERVGIPLANSLMAVDVLPYDNPFRVGLIGSYGNRWANHAVAQSDLLLVLGSRLDVRQTGADTAAFAAGRVIYQVDCDSSEPNNRVTGCRVQISDLSAFLAAALEATRKVSLPEWSEWAAEITELRSRWPDEMEITNASGINSNTLMHTLTRGQTSFGALVTDVGQHQMWAAQSCELQPHQRFLTSGGMGSMGFGLPAAIGAALSDRTHAVLLVAGDGGFQCNIQELQTVVRNALSIKIVIINNNCHGMVRQFQESYFDGRYQSTLWGYSAPSFTAVANAYGIPSKGVALEHEIADAVNWLWDTNGPALLEVQIDTFANVYPKLAFGRPISDMEPLVRPTAMEST